MSCKYIPTKLRWPHIKHGLFLLRNVKIFYMSAWLHVAHFIYHFVALYLVYVSFFLLFFNSRISAFLCFIFILYYDVVFPHNAWGVLVKYEQRYLCLQKKFMMQVLLYYSYKKFLFRYFFFYHVIYFFILILFLQRKINDSKGKKINFLQMC